MHPYAQLRLGHGFQPLRAAMYYSQRLAVGSFTRAFAADLIASAINLGGRRDRPSTATDSDPAVQTLVQDGIVHLQPLLSVAEVDINSWTGCAISHLSARAENCAGSMNCRLQPAWRLIRSKLFSPVKKSWPSPTIL